MSQPVKQHYIPKSYLKNFATCKGKDKCFTDVYFLKNELLKNNIQIKTICYQKHLYTLDSKDEENKYALELYYANNVDSEFQKIYKLLIDKKIKTLTKEQKIQILYVCLSFYFRTPKHLNHINNFTESVFERVKLYADENGMVKTKMFGDKEEYHISEIDKLKEESKKDSKNKFQIDHLEQWIEFVKYKYECTINVIEIKDNNANLITSDNPVIIRERYSNRFRGLFNPNNIITLPLDPKHFLEIHPNVISNNEYDIQRLIHDKDYVFTTNQITEENAEKLLIGKKGTIDYHFKLQDEYENNENPEKFILKAKYKAKSLSELLSLTKETGISSKQTIEHLKKMYSHPHFKGDEQIKSIIREYKEKGWM